MFCESCLGQAQRFMDQLFICIRSQFFKINFRMLLGSDGAGTVVARPVVLQILTFLQQIILRWT